MGGPAITATPRRCFRTPGLDPEFRERLLDSRLFNMTTSCGHFVYARLSIMRVGYDSFLKDRERDLSGGCFGAFDSLGGIMTWCIQDMFVDFVVSLRVRSTYFESESGS